VWVTCVLGKEKQAVGEIYQLFESIASEMWPEEKPDESDCPDDGSENTEDIETQIAKELATIKRPRKEHRFANGQTNTPCVIFISCKPPVDPVQLVLKHVENILTTGITQTRFVLRLTPVSASCSANLPDIQGLCRKLFDAYFTRENPGKKFSFKVELRFKNHTVLTRPLLLTEIGKCVPDAGHTVDLDNPEVFILVDVFKSVCGISIVKDFYKLKKFNVAELSMAHANQNSTD